MKWITLTRKQLLKAIETIGDSQFYKIAVQDAYIEDDMGSTVAGPLAVQKSQIGDSVNHPSHYQGKIEVIEFIEDQGLGIGFCSGNAIKYIARAGKKDPSKTVEDLEKAVWYIRRQIEMTKAKTEGRTPVRPNDMVSQ